MRACRNGSDARFGEDDSVGIRYGREFATVAFKCVDCGGELPDSRPQWRTWRCANCARLRRNRLNADRRRLRGRYPVTVCARCGETFYPHRADARFCSTRCRVAAHRSRVSA
jgi:DNA-directed RNA polymerase subunit RPC12/RpoP